MGTTDWIALKDIKDSYPVNLSEYAVQNKIQDEPDFYWWVPYTLKKRKSIIKNIKSKYWSRTHKFGIRVQRIFKEAKEIDNENADTIWIDAIRSEIKEIVRAALYGLKSASASFRAPIAAKLDEMNFTSCNSDPDVWYRLAVKGNGKKYYEYLLMYVDNLLEISEDATRILKEIANTFKLKNDKIAPPNSYLCAKLEYKDTNGENCWTVSSINYVKAAIANLYLALKNKPKWNKLLNISERPMTVKYFPELDRSPELNSNDITWYQEMICVLF